MKTPIRKIKRLLISKKGETIVESIVSIFIMTVLLVSVTSMIQIALRTTSSSIKEAKRVQEEIINPLISSGGSGNMVTLTFKIPGLPDVTHNVVLSANEGIIAFAPEAGGP